MWQLDKRLSSVLVGLVEDPGSFPRTLVTSEEGLGDLVPSFDLLGHQTCTWCIYVTYWQNTNTYKINLNEKERKCVSAV